MNAATSATYTKLRSGAWGVRISGTTSVGQSIIVAKRDGTTKTEIVSAIVFVGGGITLAAIGGSLSSSSSRNSRRTWGSGHGSAAYGVPGYSSYCTDNDRCRCYDCAS